MVFQQVAFRRLLISTQLRVLQLRHPKFPETLFDSQDIAVRYLKEAPRHTAKFRRPVTNCRTGLTLLRSV